MVDSVLTQRTSYRRCCRLPLNVLASSLAGATLVIYKLGRSGTTLSRLFQAVLGLGTAVDTSALYFATASQCAEIEAIIYADFGNLHPGTAAQSRISQISHFQPEHSPFSPVLPENGFWAVPCHILHPWSRRKLSHAYVNQICSHTRLIVSTARESHVRVGQLRFGLDDVSLHMVCLLPKRPRLLSLPLGRAVSRV